MHYTDIHLVEYGVYSVKEMEALYHCNVVRFVDVCVQCLNIKAKMVYRITGCIWKIYVYYRSALTIGVCVFDCVIKTGFQHRSLSYQSVGSEISQQTKFWNVLLQASKEC